MFISHKSNVLQSFHDVEWKCRKRAKGLTKPEYWTWIGTITTQDENNKNVITYPSEDFTIVECTDENVTARLNQLGDYVSNLPEGTTYNIKWSDSKTKVTVDEVEIETHFTGDDTARDARVLAEKWANVRRHRDRRLAETDFHALSDSTLADNMKTYTQSLSDVPEDNADPDDISWPVKP